MADIYQGRQSDESNSMGVPVRFAFDNLQLPIVQAPMAGAGITTPGLVIAACESGVLGFLAATYCAPEEVVHDVSIVRAGTKRPFGINLFAPTDDPSRPSDATDMLRFLQKWHLRFGLPAPRLPDCASEPFNDLMDTIIKLRPDVVSSTFGLFPREVLYRLKGASIFVMGTATTVTEAVRLEESGYDAVIAQGVEAGGHRGGFSATDESDMIGLMALIPQVVDAVSIPVVATGGIMDGRGIVAALCLGAVAVQMGTAFLMTKESGAPVCYKQRLLDSENETTTITSAFSGRRARGVRNLFLREMEDNNLRPLPYPWQNALTRPLRKAAGAAGDPEALSLWAGQGLSMAREQTVDMLVRSLSSEMSQTAGRVAAGFRTCPETSIDQIQGDPNCQPR